ncbi:Rha family transcriptional regulator [Brevibacillus reuszeri]|uniref:Rha family transcriptional regulator n=1 Tax=Brevibacillus reuszeri TaxID=54915 RepID=UPI000CCC5A37|nr:Rha family transcriptional regulator [Brevibacillus reuszeri]
MSNLVFVQHGQPVTDSLTIAEVFDKDHRNVLRDIESQIEKLNEAGEQKWGVLNFEQTHYQHQQNKQWYPKYNMTEDGFTLIAMSYVTPEAMKMKIRFIQEFKRMREKLAANVVPLDERRVRLELFKQAIEHEERLDSVEQKIMEIDHKVETQITLNSREQRILRKAVQKRGMELAEQVTFRQLTMVRDGIGEDIQKIRSQLFREIYRDLWDRFGVSSYADILKKDLDAALGYVSNWIPRQVA